MNTKEQMAFLQAEAGRLILSAARVAWPSLCEEPSTEYDAALDELAAFMKRDDLSFNAGLRTVAELLCIADVVVRPENDDGVQDIFSRNALLSQVDSHLSGVYLRRGSEA